MSSTTRHPYASHGQVLVMIANRLAVSVSSPENAGIRGALLRLDRFPAGRELIISLTAKESTRHAIAPQAYVEFYSLITRVRLPRHTTKGAKYTEITAKAARTRSKASRVNVQLAFERPISNERSRI